MSKERFKKPTDKQVIETAILFNEGKIEQEKRADMGSHTLYVIDRLYDNGDIMIPSKEEKVFVEM